MHASTSLPMLAPTLWLLRTYAPWAAPWVAGSSHTGTGLGCSRTAGSPCVWGCRSGSETQPASLSAAWGTPGWPATNIQVNKTAWVYEYDSVPNIMEIVDTWAHITEFKLFPNLWTVLFNFWLHNSFSQWVLFNLVCFVLFETLLYYIIKS